MTVVGTKMNDQLDSDNSSRTLPVYALSVTDESQVSLFELWQILVAKRILIASLIACSILAGIIHIVTSPTLYRAEVFLLRPLAQDVDVRVQSGASISGLDIVGVDISHVTPKFVYTEFKKNYNSRRVRRDFFDASGLFSHYVKEGENESVGARQAFAEFNANLSTSEGGGDLVRVTLDFEDADRVAEILNAYVGRVNQITLDSVYLGVERAILTRVQFLRGGIDRKRELSKMEKLDRIAQLEEAIEIASVMGLENHSNLPWVNSVVETELGRSVTSTPLYLRGTKSLIAEVERLHKRQQPDAFIPDFRELEAELGFLESLKLDRSNLRAAIIDEAAVTPDHKIKPRRLLILAGSTLFGAVLAVLVALIIGIMQRQRRNGLA